MLNQSFELHDLTAVVVLIALEGLLSGDNALILAMLVRHLPKAEQARALRYGLIGAFVFRLIAIIFASLVLRLWWLQSLGALYLLYVTVQHFWPRRAAGKTVEKKERGFWMTVLTVEIMDIAFAVDSVLAGVAFVSGRVDKVWVVFVGAIVGVVLLRFVAQWFVDLLEKYPMLDHVAYSIVGWVGVKLSFLSIHSFEAGGGKLPGNLHVPEMSQSVFWIGLVVIILVGWIVIARATKTRQAKDEGEYPLKEDGN